MPELPEVEVLVRALRVSLRGKRIRDVRVQRPKVTRPTGPERLREALLGAEFLGVTRRGKYLKFQLRASRDARRVWLIGHLGMTGRMVFRPRGEPLPKHTAVALVFDDDSLVFEDPRYFGRLSLDTEPLARLGPEPLGRDFTPGYLGDALSRSSQPVKVRLLDQSVGAGVGNIYASEALFRARIAPDRPARGLEPAEVRALWRAIRRVLREAVAWGSTVPLDWAGAGARDGLFYYGRAPGTPDDHEERLRVYGRAGQACLRCGGVIVRSVLGGRATYSCPDCVLGPPQVAQGIMVSSKSPP